MTKQQQRSEFKNPAKDNLAIAEEKKHNYSHNGLISRRQFIGATLGAAALSTLGFSYAYAVEPTWIELSLINLSLPRLAVEFSGYRIAQFSDIHMDNIQMDSTRLAEIVTRINELSPDLIVITGDFIAASHHSGDKITVDELATPLKQLGATDGVIGILGNHDHEEAPEMVRSVLNSAGIIELSNAVHTIKRAASTLHIAGVDDVLEGKADFDAVLGQLPENGAAILLVHEPDFADTAAATRRFDLQLSGHSHGGQIVAPLLGPIILPPDGRKYPQGLYQVQDMMLYTNKGIGTVPPRLRFNCQPEITVFTLEAQ